MIIAAITIASLILIEVCLLYLTTDGLRQFGKPPSDERQKRYLSSGHFDNGKFHNKYGVELAFSSSDYWKLFKRLFFGKEVRQPDVKIPVNKLRTDDFTDLPDSGLTFTWLAHSTVLLEIDGKRILTDPVWKERTSPSSLAGPKRFHEMPIELKDLPPIDIVILSHDHYDHLDMEAVKFLAERGCTFLTALGVGSHLEYWGIDSSRIYEMNWWDAYLLANDYKIICTPAQHFSGRSWVGGRNKTFWSTWSIAGPHHRVFFCGDTGEIPEMKEVGEKIGPFDLTLMKIGAYDDKWPDIHLTPEQSVRLHHDLKGQLFMPIHWGSFNLAFHGWKEPVKRLVKAAGDTGTDIITPYPGQRLSIDSLPECEPWWQNQGT